MTCPNRLRPRNIRVVKDFQVLIISSPNFEFSFSLGVYMKTRCYMPTVQQLCSLWDQKLALLREDLTYYQDGKTEEGELFIPFDKFDKHAQINEALEKRCVQSVRKYCLAIFSFYLIT